MNRTLGPWLASVLLGEGRAVALRPVALFTLPNSTQTLNRFCAFAANISGTPSPCREERVAVRSHRQGWTVGERAVAIE